MQTLRHALALAAAFALSIASDIDAATGNAQGNGPPSSGQVGNSHHDLPPGFDEDGPIAVSGAQIVLDTGYTHAAMAFSAPMTPGEVLLVPDIWHVREHVPGEAPVLVTLGCEACPCEGDDLTGNLLPCQVEEPAACSGEGGVTLLGIAPLRVAIEYTNSGSATSWAFIGIADASGGMVYGDWMFLPDDGGGPHVIVWDTGLVPPTGDYYVQVTAIHVDPQDGVPTTEPAGGHPNGETENYVLTVDVAMPAMSMLGAELSGTGAPISCTDPGGGS